MLSVPIFVGAVISSGLGTAAWYFAGSFLGTVGLFSEALVQSMAIGALFGAIAGIWSALLR